MKNDYLNHLNSFESKLSNLPLVGKLKSINNKQRRLSMFFNFTKENPDYANNRNSKGKYIPVFITLTYPDNKDWKVKDITGYLKKIKQYALVNWALKLRIAWVAETTKSGTIHYHLVTWIPRKERLPIPNQPYESRGKTIKPMWAHRAQIEGVRKGVYGYMLKYITKGVMGGGLGFYKRVDGKKSYPRVFGYSGLDKVERERISYFMLPEYVKNAFGYTRVGDNIRRQKGGWKLKKKNMVDKIYKYFTYCENQLLTNFTKDIYQLNNSYHIEYHFGCNWSQIQDINTDDIWYPF